MNWDQLQERWATAKGQIRVEWTRLTDQDVDMIAGKKDQLVGALRQRYGMEREKAYREIDRWLHGFERPEEHDPVALGTGEEDDDDLPTKH